jgi:hypothetical protein
MQVEELTSGSLKRQQYEVVVDNYLHSRIEY